jgi:hypothetical protein
VKRKAKTKVKRRARVKIRAPKETYTTADLMERYGCTQRTIRRWTRELGFPQGEFGGHEYVYLIAAVHAWEKIHKPHLHPQAPVYDDTQDWNDRAAILKGEQAAAALAARLKEREEKPRPRK